MRMFPLIAVLLAVAAFPAPLAAQPAPAGVVTVARAAIPTPVALKVKDNITGGLVSFGGAGSNLVNVANSLCPCTTLAGVPVAFQNGATAANVSIGPNPIRNGNLGTLGLASPIAAAIVVSGPTSRVTIGAP
jgi:hypothetical protein